VSFWLRTIGVSLAQADAEALIRDHDGDAYAPRGIKAEARQDGKGGYLVTLPHG